MSDSAVQVNEQVLFGAAIVIGFLITIHFCLKKTTTIADYVWGSGRMGLLPITLSLFASNVSCVSASMISEYYQYGIHFLYETIPVMLNCFLIVEQCKVMLPFKFISANQYLSLRFDNNIKLFISIVFLISQTTYATVICFSAAVLVKSLLQVSFFASFFIIFLFCFILASMGGFKGVVWNDAFQALIITGSMVFMAIVATVTVGGVSKVFGAAYESGRLDTDFRLDPTIRLTFWISALGFTTNWIASNSLFNPAMYQRFVSLGEEHVTKGSFLSGAITALIKLIICYLGYTMYAYYEGCDPVQSGQVDQYAQIQNFFVNDISRKWSMLRGIYSIGYVCAGISTMTTILNTCGVVAYQDFFERRFNPTGTPAKAKIIIILVESTMFLVCSLLFLIIESGDNITSFIPLYGSPNAVIASTFMLGMFAPCVNSKGILIASVIVLPLSLIWSWSCNLASIQGLIHHPVKPMRIDRCPFNVTSPVIETSAKQNDVFPLLQVTVFYHPIILFLLHIGISLTASHFWKSSGDKKVNKTLVHPWCHRFIRKYNAVPQRLDACSSEVIEKKEEEIQYSVK